MGYSFRLTARVLLYAPSHRQDSTYHGLCGALAGARTANGSQVVDVYKVEAITDRKKTTFTIVSYASFFANILKYI